MPDLFRYVEHAFAIPQAISVVDVANQSHFQSSLRDAASQEGYPGVRRAAEAFLDSTFPSPTDDPLAGSAGYRRFRTALDLLEPVDRAAITALVSEVFGQDLDQLTHSDQFRSDKQVMENAVLAVKVATGFDRVDATKQVDSLQTIAFLGDLAEDSTAQLSRDSVRRALGRPVRVPAEFLLAPEARVTADPASEPGPDAEQQRLLGLRDRRDTLRATYRSLMAVSPDRLEAVSTAADADGPAILGVDRPIARQDPASPAEGSSTLASSTTTVRLSRSTVRALPVQQQEMLDGLDLDLARASLPQLVAALKQQLVETNAQVLPYEVPGSARVFRVGTTAFASTPLTPLAGADIMLAAGPAAALPEPDFSHAITRPVGYGNLLVVRQELVGYQPGDVSHIENVLEGEVLRRTTRRKEVNEVTITYETDMSSSQERDLQSTDRNELASETQKTTGSTTSTSGELSTSTDYGKLVENSKSNYAQSVTSRAVDTLTSRVKQQRVQRERKTFVESATHELDNKAGTTKIRGIYQWVDKTYEARVLNYGRRLLYDVVVPEPAAFLIKALTDAVQPEAFQLVKPNDPQLQPLSLDVSNYGYYAAQYGVTGAVSPPPQEFTQTVAHVDAQDVHKVLTTFGQTSDGAYFAAFTMHVPDGFHAMSGYLQRTNVHWVNKPPDRELEVYVGEHTFLRFSAANINGLNSSFTMSAETGDIPVTLRTFANTAQFNYAVGINCRRTDDAYNSWQLKTHAAIMAGYQRQLADYQDKLGRYTAAVRAQLAQSGGLARDSSVQLDELKKAFLFLLLGEHPAAYLPTPVTPMPPYGKLPNPLAVKKWGAMVAFFERAFEWENLMYTFYPYFWGRPSRWTEMVLTQDADAQFEAFMKAGAARIVVAVRPGFEAALAHYQETGDVWLGEEMPDIYSDDYVSIIAEIKAANLAPGQEVCVDHWQVTLPTTLVMLKDDEVLPSWTPTPCVDPSQP